MRTPKIMALVTVLALALALPLTVHAGGWSTINLDPPQSGYTAGQETTVGFTVLQHGQTPIDGLTPIVKLSHPASGERLTVSAVESGPKGHYVAKIVFPSAGTWQWEINAFEGDHPLPPLEVAAAPGAAPAGLAVAQSLGMPWPALLGLALAAGALATLIYTRRFARRPA